VVNQQIRQQYRQHERAPVTFALLYLAEGQKVVRAGRASDLSRSGIRISGPATLARGTAIALRFSLPGTVREIVLRGTAVMSFFDGSRQEYLHGIAFTHIGQAEQESIAQFVRESLDSAPELLREQA